jgi:hypothetical protein
MDWRQVWNEDLDTHRQKLPWSHADENNLNINEENKLCQILTKKNKQIWYDRFQQIPFGDFSREGLTGSKFEVKFWTLIGGICLGLLQTKTTSNIKEEK